MADMSKTLFVTADGSHTLYSEQFAQHYHSTHGALQESMHIFLQCGLLHYISGCREHTELLDRPIRIFEVGFGTGLNALLSSLYMDQSRPIHYQAVELYPVDAAEYQQLQFHLPFDEAYRLLQEMHQAPWNVPVELGSHFTLHKIHGDAVKYPPTEVDVVYFDAFSPDVQPELWALEMFQRLFAAMTVGGVLVTYCAKGEVRRRMQAAGFKVERIPGPPGKREILRATK